MKEPTLNANDLLLLEQPLLKVPVEGLKRNVRQGQRAADKEFQFCAAAVQELGKGSPSPQDALKSVDAMLNRMRGLKRKLADLSTSNESLVAASQTRLLHLDAMNSLDTVTSPKYREWAKIRLHRQIADHLLRKGHVLSAKQLAKDTDTQLLVDDALFSECATIESSLYSRSATEALAWCKENQNGLKRINSTIEFDLRFQEYIELVRAGQNAEAIIYSRKHLVPWGATHMPQIRQGLTLLAFGPSTSCPPYRKFFDVSRWKTLAINFRYILLALHSLAPLSMLALSIHTGLAVLKTPSCFAAEDIAHNVDCPVCASKLNELAESRSVPWAHHANSTIVCKITNKVLEGDDPGREPLALPNGRVYSREALEASLSQNNGKIVCPYTHDLYKFSETLKVFIS